MQKLPSAAMVLVLMMDLLGQSVCAGATQTVWKSPVDGSWSNDTAWTAGVPDGNAALLTNTAASYTDTVGSTPTTPYGNLSLSTGVGYTTILSVVAPEFTSTNGILSFGQGARVDVNAGGVMRYVGRTPASSFVSISGGGVWHINGGLVDFSNLRVPSSGNSSINIGNTGFSVTSCLEVTSGKLALTGLAASETNNTVSLNIASVSRGCGLVSMTGGQMLIANNEVTATALNVGGGTYASGLLALAGDAFLSVSNYVKIGSSSSTGTVSVAGNSIFRANRGTVYMAYAANSAATMNVSDAGWVDLSGSGLYVGGAGGSATLNVNGGLLEASGIQLCRANGATGCAGTLNLTAGQVSISAAGGGIIVGYESKTTGNAQAYLNISGGLMDLSRGVLNNAANQNGLVVGEIGTAVGGIASGFMTMTDGVVTNAGQFILGAGLGATGTVQQVGGDVRQGMGRSGVTSYPMTVGWGGGTGRYTLSGGTFVSDKNVFIGGITTNDLGYTPTSILFANSSTGIVRIEAGSFSVNTNLFLGRSGTGTLVVGSTGVCTAMNVSITDNSQSTLRFEFGSGGVGSLSASNALSIGTGAKLEVDTSAYRGSETRIKLVGCATRMGTFDVENIVVTGRGFVRQNLDQNIWLCRTEGTVLCIR